MLENGVVKLEVNSPVVRDALLDGCAWVIQFENREQPTKRVNGFDPELLQRRIVLATTLDEQLVAGCAVADVPLEIADAVARNLAGVIVEEMDALACDTCDEQPRGRILVRASGLMESLVALDAGIQQEVLRLTCSGT